MQDRLTADIVAHKDKMTPKSDIVKARVPPEVRAKLEAVAEEAGLTVSGLLRVLIDGVVEGVEAPTVMPSRSRREGKLTARLPLDVRQKIEDEARSQGVTASTWVSVLLSARMRNAPQIVPGERRGVRAAYRQLRGLAVNANQIAYALNRGVLTGAGADLTKAEVEGLRQDIAKLRMALSVYAEGRFQFQSAEGEQL